MAYCTQDDLLTLISREELAALRFDQIKIRTFRGATYRFDFRNPCGRQQGVEQILLDGKPIEGDRLPLPTAKHHTVVVRM